MEKIRKLIRISQNVITLCPFVHSLLFRMKNVMVLLVLIIISSAVVYSNSAVRFLQVHFFDLLSDFFDFLKLFFVYTLGLFVLQYQLFISVLF